MSGLLQTYYDIRAGSLCVYSVRRDNKRVATVALALGATSTKPQLAELRPPQLPALKLLVQYSGDSFVGVTM
jgi:hypothetical protein